MADIPKGLNEILQEGADEMGVSLEAYTEFVKAANDVLTNACLMHWYEQMKEAFNIWD